MSWEKCHAHAAQHRVSGPDAAHVRDMAAFRTLCERHGGESARFSEPTEGNQMQSPAYVMFAAYDLTGWDAPEDGAPFAVAEYCEGDVNVDRYATAEHRDRALWLLERAL